jgi:hypothetical protein
MAWLAYKVAEAMVNFFVVMQSSYCHCLFQTDLDTFVSTTKATKVDVLAVDRTAVLRAAFIIMNAV